MNSQNIANDLVRFINSAGLNDPEILQYIFVGTGVITLALAILEIRRGGADEESGKVENARLSELEAEVSSLRDENRKLKSDSVEEVAPEINRKPILSDLGHRPISELETEILQRKHETASDDLPEESELEEAEQKEPDIESAFTEKELEGEQEPVVEAKDEPLELPKSEILNAGLIKTRSNFLSKLKSFFNDESTSEKDEFFEKLEVILILGDVGVKTTGVIISRVKEALSSENSITEAMVLESLKKEMLQILQTEESPDLLPEKVDKKPKVVLVIGVNGAGKTTTIAKLANRFKENGAKVILAAGDTFRAAAVEQLCTWGSRLDLEVVSGAEGAKPSTIAYEAIHKAGMFGADVVIIDTAGRLHTRVNLMKELESVVKIIEREQPGAPHEILLVVDGTSGQNALVQAKEFSAAADVSGVVVTKLDGTPKGGIVLAIKEELGIPVRFIGVGEKMEDLRLFDPGEFVSAIIDGNIDEESAGLVEEGDSDGGDEPPKPRAKVRRRRAS